MSDKGILDENNDEEEILADSEQGEVEVTDDGVESHHTAMEEPKECRCQKRRKRKYALQEPGSESEPEEDEEEADEEESQGNSEEDEDEYEESLSEYESIFSVIPFEWENENYEFVDLCDPGTMDNIYQREEVEVTYDAYGKTYYLIHCDQMGIPPVIRFYNALSSNEADLTFHGITDKQMKAVCTALEMNQCVEALIVKGNPLSMGCCHSLSSLLLKNSIITHLNLSGCRIGPEGAALLARGLKDNEAVRELNLSKCYIQDKGMTYMAYALKENYSVENLTLSHNSLGAEAAEALGTILFSNNSIRCIDLDNNNMFDSASMRKFCRGFGFNTAVTWVSLKWNAISSFDIGLAMFQFLKRNKTVKHLDLSDNRIDGQCVRPLRKGVAASQSIETLRLGRNPITAEDAEYLLSGVKSCPSLKLLDLQEIWVRKDFMKNLKKIQLVKEVEVIIGGVYSDYIIRGPDYAALIMKRARFEALKPKKSSAKRDFGHFIFMLGDEPLTTDQFMTLVTKFRAKINKELFPELIKQFTIPKLNTIDVVAMRKKYLSLFPNSKPPEPKKQQKNVEDEEKTNIAESEAQEEQNKEEMK